MKKEELKEYLKYYFLEKYLFGEVSKNFRDKGSLTPEEFFAIVIWKRNASKTRIKEGIGKYREQYGKTIKNITEDIYSAESLKQKLNILAPRKIYGIGISFASAILTVCYPNDFTIADYRAFNSLIKLLDKKEFSDIKEKFKGLKKYIDKYLKRRDKINAYNATHTATHTKKKSNDINDITDDIYLEYLEACKELAGKLNFPLRDFDRILWGMDSYEGKDGLRDLVKNLK